MDIHLADAILRHASNHLNGSSRQMVYTGSERIVGDIPRDRQGRFDPVLIDNLHYPQLASSSR